MEVTSTEHRLTVPLLIVAGLTILGSAICFILMGDSGRSEWGLLFPLSLTLAAIYLVVIFAEIGLRRGNRNIWPAGSGAEAKAERAAVVREFFVLPDDSDQARAARRFRVVAIVVWSVTYLWFFVQYWNTR